MLLEWVGPSPDATTDAGYNAYIEDFHTKLTTVGTGVTHLAHLPDQYDMVNAGAIPTPAGTLLEYSSPLYYKFESDGNKTLYLIIQFGVYYPYDVNETHVRSICSKVTICENLGIDGVPLPKNYSNSREVNGASIVNVTHNTTYAIPTLDDPEFKYSASDSFISSNGGVLIVQSNLGMKTSHTSDYEKSVVSIMIVSEPDSYTSIGFYDVSLEYYDSMSSDPVLSLGSIEHNISAINFKGSLYSKLRTSTMLLVPRTNIMSLYSISADSQITPIKDIYYYDRGKVAGNGRTTIGAHDYWLSGLLLKSHSISGADAQQYSYAIRIS